MKAKFLLEDVFTITGRGQILCGVPAKGRMSDGNINVGDIIQMGNKFIIVKGIEMFRKEFNTSQVGDNIGIYIDNQMTKEESSVFRKTLLNVITLSELRDYKINQILP